MRGGMFPSGGFRRNIDTIDCLSAWSEIRHGEPGVERNGFQLEIWRAIGADADGEGGVVIRAHTEVVNRAGAHGRSTQGVGSGWIKVRIRSGALIFTVRGPFFNIAIIAGDSITGRNGVAHVNNDVTGLLAEGQVYAAGNSAGGCEAIVPPVTTSDQLVGEVRSVQRQVGNRTGRDPKPVTRIRITGRADSHVPETRLEFYFSLAVEGHPVGVFRRIGQHGTIINRSRGSGSVVIKSWRSSVSQIKVGITADCFQNGAQETIVCSWDHYCIVVQEPLLEECALIGERNAVGIDS